MSQVSNQFELQQALAMSDPLIEIINDFNISSQITVLYPVQIQGTGQIRTLTRQAGFSGILIAIGDTGDLILENLVLDGDKTNSPSSLSIIWTAGRVTFDNTIIQNGASSSSGAGIITTDAAAVCVLRNHSVVQGCESQGVGGGIYLTPGSSLEATQSAIENNEAAGDGGGLFANTDSSVTFTDSIVSNNISGLNGGGAFINFNTNVILTGTGFLSNSGVDGGGLYLNQAILLCEGYLFSGNTASKNGGALLVDGGTVNVANTTFSDNHASNGGGLFLNPNSVFNNDNISFIGNTALLNGGGIYLNFSDISMANASLFGNRAENGGAVFVNFGGNFHYSGESISTNTASGAGGGVFVNEGATADIKGGAVTDNAADDGGGIFVNGSGQLTLTNSDILKNTASSNGGGILVSSGSAVVSGSRIAGNRATSGAGVYGGAGGTLTITNTTLNHNTAAADGGGLYLQFAIASLTGTAVYNNTAGNGAGIYIAQDGRLFYTASDISRNSASGDGGAVYLAEGGEAHLTAPVSVYGNTAGNAAPGVYDDGWLGLGGADSILDGVYIVSENNQIQVEASLAGAHIQLLRSPYVLPEPAGSPIDVAEATEEYPILTAEDEAAFIKPAPGFENWVVKRNDANTHIQLSILLQYPIIYENLMGAYNPNPATYGENTLPIILQNPSPLPGYCFVGWFNAPAGGEQVTEIQEGMIGAITLYARWEIIRPVPLCPSCCCYISCCYLSYKACGPVFHCVCTCRCTRNRGWKNFNGCFHRNGRQ